jgi:hypothetical protein
MLNPNLPNLTQPVSGVVLKTKPVPIFPQSHPWQWPITGSIVETIDRPEGSFTIKRTDGGRLIPSDLSVNVGEAIANALSKMAYLCIGFDLERRQRVEKAAHDRKVETKKRQTRVVADFTERVITSKDGSETTHPPRNSKHATKARAKAKARAASAKVKNLAKLVGVCDADSVKAFCKAENVDYAEVLAVAESL